jgi:hypothetical protein
LSTTDSDKIHGAIVAAEQAQPQEDSVLNPNQLMNDAVGDKSCEVGSSTEL